MNRRQGLETPTNATYGDARHLIWLIEAVVDFTTYNYTSERVRCHGHSQSQSSSA